MNLEYPTRFDSDDSASQSVLVTGGLGFIGSALIRYLLANTRYFVVNIDKVSYAADLAAVPGTHERYQFVHGDICVGSIVRGVLESYKPSLIFHLAAETHVDNSIRDPAPFIQTNVIGTFTLIEEVRRFLENAGRGQSVFRFIHISTDEVFGSAKPSFFFTESSCYNPSSPYSASKASSDHLVRAWGTTYRFPAIIVNCTNNYGPYQHHEKLIPTLIRTALHHQPVPLYGDGLNVRDWIFVDDHVSALLTVAKRGDVGAQYVIGANATRTNYEVATIICDLLDELRPHPGFGNRRSLIQFIPDRLGHDFRYAVDASRLRMLGWHPRYSFEMGIRNTVEWYLQQATRLTAGQHLR